MAQKKEWNDLTKKEKTIGLIGATVIVIIVLGIISSFSSNNGQKTEEQTAPQSTSNNVSTLPTLNTNEYINKEGLVVYKDLKSKGYVVTAEFGRQAVADINGNPSDVFEPLDPNKMEDRLSVDAFVVESVTQDGDSVKIIIK